MHRTAYLVAVLLAFSATTSAATFTFDSDPFAGSDALSTPGRQIVGGEPFINFDIASDVFEFNPAVFGAGDLILFVNDLVENLPDSGVNVIVLQTAPIPFNAGLAANAIADQITSSGAGFFIYFNSNLDLPRLVYSTNLSDNTADLKILARMVNLSGQSGRDALSTFSESNFVLTPEPSTFLLMTAAGALWGCGAILRRRRVHGSPRDLRLRKG
jgi:hypothetical protein